MALNSNIAKVLRKISNEFVVYLRSDASIDSGVLKKSFKQKQKNNETIFTMAYYGQFGSSYKDKIPPILALQNKINEESKQIIEAYIKDLQTRLKNNTNKIRK